MLLLSNVMSDFGWQSPRSNFNSHGALKGILNLPISEEELSLSLTMISSYAVESYDLRMRGTWLYEPELLSKRWGGAMVSIKVR